MTYIMAQEDGAFDYGFSDFWGGLSDGLPLYLSFAKGCARFRHTIHDYWIENTFIDYYFRPAIMIFLMEKVLGRKERPLDSGKEGFRNSEEIHFFSGKGTFHVREGR